MSLLRSSQKLLSIYFIEYKVADLIFGSGCIQLYFPLLALRTLWHLQGTDLGSGWKGTPGLKLHWHSNAQFMGKALGGSWERLQLGSQNLKPSHVLIVAGLCHYTHVHKCPFLCWASCTNIPDACVQSEGDRAQSTSTAWGGDGHPGHTTGGPCPQRKSRSLKQNSVHPEDGGGEE